MDEDERQIRALVSTWMRATKAGDSAAVLDLMTDDARFLVPGAPPFGKEAFAAASEGMQASDVAFDGDGEVLEVQVSGDWAYMLTRLTVVTRRAGAPDSVRAGHTLTVLRKRAGRWQIHRDANLLAPVEAGAA